MKTELKELMAKSIQKIDVAGTAKGYKKKIAESCAEVAVNFVSSKQDVMKSLPSDGKVNKLLVSLDKYARELNEREYGLPIYSDEKLKSRFKDIVNNWIMERGNVL